MGLAVKGFQSDTMVRLLTPNRPTGLSLNMRNSSLSKSSIDFLMKCLKNPLYYLTALNLKFCFLKYMDCENLAEGLVDNKTLVKLDLSNNGFKHFNLKPILNAI